VVKLQQTPGGSVSILYSTYLGGTGDDQGRGFTVNAEGNAYIAGNTGFGSGFPLVNEYQSEMQGTRDAFITKLVFGSVTQAPTVTTPGSEAVAYTTAVLGGNITDTGGEEPNERGIYWSTIDGFDPVTEGNPVSETGSFGTGPFSLPVDGLPDNTAIYFRAFAVNSMGTGYSQQASFTTYLSGAVPTPQREGLEDFYSSLDGSSWTNSTGWGGEPGTEDTWYGVTAVLVNGMIQVTGVDLRYNNLQGPLPTEKPDWPYLRYLKLKGNDITGGIPDWLWNMDNLLEIDLSLNFNLGGNDLTGNIPEWINKLENLRFLKLYYNTGMTGQISSSITQLDKLEVLDIRGTGLYLDPTDEALLTGRGVYIRK
jgi:hypothetical protein